MIPHPTPHPEEFQRKLERLVRFKERKIGVHTSVEGVRAPVRVIMKEDFFKIEFEPSFVRERVDEARKAWVRAREQREKFFRFEFRSQDGDTQMIGIPGPEGTFEFSVSVQGTDSLVRVLQKEQMRQMERLRTMDSLLQQRFNRSRNVRSPRSSVSSSDTPDVVRPEPPRE